MFLLIVQFCFGQNDKPYFLNSNIDFHNPKSGQHGSFMIDYGCDRYVRPVYEYVLDSIADEAFRFPKTYFIIESHTDCRSDSIYNLELSRRRADSICAYIHRKFNNIKNLKCIGMGESDPVNDCRCEGNYILKKCTEEEHQQNRRTVLKVVDKF